jgi:hypothetical protein
MKGQYTAEISLNQDERPMIYNNRTQEIKDIPKYKNNIPEGKHLFEPEGIFRKDYTNSWNFLKRTLTPIEYKAAHTLAMLAKANTNSLQPLNDDTTLKELMEVLDVSKNKVKPILDKLWDLGVYGRFDVKEADKPYTKYWLFNPYLSFSGKLIHSDIATLFSGTHCAKAFKDSEYSYKR